MYSILSKGSLFNPLSSIIFIFIMSLNMHARRDLLFLAETLGKKKNDHDEVLRLDIWLVICREEDGMCYA